MFIISDSHIDADSAPRFFAMLDRLESRPEAVIFLGDIFELWIALPGYEEAHHQRFLDWVDRRRAAGPFSRDISRSSTPGIWKR